MIRWAAVFLLAFSADAAMIRVSVRGARVEKIALASKNGDDIRWLTAKKTRNTAVFDALGGGTYVVAVCGAGPFECASQLVAVGNDDSRAVELALEPFPIAARITHGGRPLAGELTVVHAEHGWESVVRSDVNGWIRTTAWSRGRLRYTLRAGTLDVAGDVDLGASGFAIDVPARRATGRVLSIDGKPIHGARVSLRTPGEGFTATYRAVTDRDGRYAFDGLHAGTQSLLAVADGRVRMKPFLFDMKEQESAREVDLTLPGGVWRNVEVVDVDGAAVAGATLISLRDDAVVIATTDEYGHAAIELPARAETLYAFPRRGAFVMQPLPFGDDDVRVRVRVPSAAGSLRFTALGPGGSGIAGIRVIARYDGALIPPEVLRRGAIAGATAEDGAMTLEHLPLGTWELWPYTTDEEADAILASVSSAPPAVRVQVAAGRNSVTLRFEKRDGF